MTPGELLGQADRLLTSPPADLRGRWPRACAWLIRLALEGALDRYWSRELPEAAQCSMRAQLLLLPSHAGASAGEHARDAWHALSRAAHHHVYELAPTAAELRGWHDAVSQLTRDLDASNAAA